MFGFIKNIKEYYIQYKLNNMLDKYETITLPSIYDYLDLFISIVDDEVGGIEDSETLKFLETIIYEYYGMEDYNIITFDGIDYDINDLYGEDVIKYLVSLRIFLIKNYFLNPELFKKNDDGEIYYKEFNSFEEAKEYAVSSKINQVSQKKEAFYHTFSNVSSGLKDWLLLEIKDNNCIIESVFYYDKQSSIFYLEKPEIESEFTIVIVISSKLQENINFVNKRYTDRLEKLNKRINKLENIYKNDAS